MPFKIFSPLLFLFCFISIPAISQPLNQQFKSDSDRLISNIMQNNEGFERLTEFVDTFGHRFSGSESLERSLDWIVEKLKEDGFDVWEQPVKVPHWVRGQEYATLKLPREKNLKMLGLGGSVATPKEGIEADVLVVNSFEDLIQKKEQAKGKIVLYNVEFTSYGQTVTYRMNGAIEAGRYGAVASLIRSVGPFGMQTPHTGTSRYEDGITKIPHAAITMEDAMLIQRFSDRGQTVRIHLYMEAKTLPDADSRNIVAEIKGSEFPNEIVVMGGHIDSWDVGQGVMDDAGGCFAAWEALRAMKQAGFNPKRTVRIVFWTNEENGLRGANAYLEAVEKDGSLKNHIFALESDSGVFDPTGIGFSGSDEAFEILTDIGRLLSPIESGVVVRGGGGADIGPLMNKGVPGAGLNVEGEKYFWYHHTEADDISMINQEDFKECAATMAIFTYVVAAMDKTLPK